MNLEIVIDFFKQENLYDAEYFEKIKNNTRVYNKAYEEIKDFIGCYPVYDDNKDIINFKLILPKIKDIYDIYNLYS